MYVILRVEISLIQESQEPQRNLVVLAHLRIVTGLDGIWITTHLDGSLCITDSEFSVAIHCIIVVFAALVNFVVFPKLIDEECFHHFLLVNLYRIDRVHQVSIMHHHLRWFLRKSCPSG